MLIVPHRCKAKIYFRENDAVNSHGHFLCKVSFRCWIADSNDGCERSTVVAGSVRRSRVHPICEPGTTGTLSSTFRALSSCKPLLAGIDYCRVSLLFGIRDEYRHVPFRWTVFQAGCLTMIQSSSLDATSASIPDLSSLAPHKKVETSKRRILFHLLRCHQGPTWMSQSDDVRRSPASL